jgi:hypothetical protein
MQSVSIETAPSWDFVLSKALGSRALLIINFLVERLKRGFRSRQNSSFSLQRGPPSTERPRPLAHSTLALHNRSARASRSKPPILCDIRQVIPNSLVINPDYLAQVRRIVDVIGYESRFKSERSSTSVLSFKGNFSRHKGYELHGVAAVELCRMLDASLGSVPDDGPVTTLKLMHNQRLIANWTGLIQRS